LYGRETWSLTIRGKRRLRLFENRVLRRIFWPNKNEITGDWRKLHNEKLNDVLLTKYYLGDQIDKNELGGTRSK